MLSVQNGVLPLRVINILRIAHTFIIIVQSHKEIRSWMVFIIAVFQVLMLRT